MTAKTVKPFSRLADHQYGRIKLFIGLILVLIGCLYGGYRLGFHSLVQHQDLVKAQQQRLEQLYQDSDSQLQQINFLKVEIEVEKQAALYVTKKMQQLQEENFKLQNDLTFYHKIMAPELEADGIALHSFELSKTPSVRTYHYKVVLVQTTKRKRFAKGFIEFKVKGSLYQKSKTYSLKALVPDYDKKSLNFSFRYFQILEGDLTLPEGFNPEKVFIAAVLPTRKWQKYSRLDHQYPWDQKN